MRSVSNLMVAAATLAVITLAERGQAAVRINEVMAKNDSAVRNGSAYPRSYVELYNDSANSVNIGGWYLTNNTNTTDRTKYAFPPGTVIQPLSFLMVWCNKETNGPGLFTGFDLKSTTDEVGLYQGPTNALVLLDYVKFGFQITDLSISRVPDGLGQWKLTNPTPGYDNATAMPLGTSNLLKFNEWLGNTPTSDDWFEIYNPTTNGPVDMAGLVIMDLQGGTKIIPPLSFVTSNGFALFIANNNSGAKAPANECPFRLDGTSGDALFLLPYPGAPASSAIHRVLTGAQVENASSGYLPDGNTNNLVTFFVGKSTPGESNFQLITNVAINEILAHTDPPLEDAIEFYNLTTNEVRLDYYYLSNNEDTPKKYQFPANTVIPPLGYLVLYEYSSFNPDRTGNFPSFTLNSAHGDQVVLCSATNTGGQLTGFRLSKTFGASANGVSWGRFIKSDGKTDLVPMSQRTFGAASNEVFTSGKGATNVYPLVGPIVISEIMYHPPDIIQGTNILDDSLNEYIELSNFAVTNAPLYNPAEPTNHWTLTTGVEFEFPAGALVPARGCVLVVNFDPATNAAQLAAFKAKWNVPADFTRFYGPYKGKLANDTMLVELYKPDPAQQPPHPDAGYVPQIFVEKVHYEDQAPWPTNQVDGGGWSLHRILEQYANDEINWFAAPPSPGVFGDPPVITQAPQSQSVVVGGAATFNVTAVGADLGYQWQFNTQYLPNATNATMSLANVQTNQAGGYRVIITNNSGSVTSITATLTVAGQPVMTQPAIQTDGSIQLAFTSTPGFNYAVEGSLTLTNWVTLATYSNVSTQVIYTQPNTNGHQFFRARLLP